MLGRFVPRQPSAGDATVYDVFGVLCARGSIHGKTIQIALHGATYSHLYWDWPYQPAVYSYMSYATTAGYAVLNLDRIGIGRSDHPPADAVTIDSNAYVVHQIVQALRDGDRVVPGFGRIRAERVALVGHSLGGGLLRPRTRAWEPAAARSGCGPTRRSIQLRAVEGKPT